MSWFIGYTGIISNEIMRKFEKYFGNDRIIAKDTFRIAFNGKNINYENDFLAAGIFTDSAQRIISNPIFENVNKFRENYKGNYACVTFDNDKLLIFNDLLGIRELFIYKNEEFVVFATSPELIAKLIGFKLNFESFAGRWLLENQFGYSSLYAGIQRLTSNSVIEIPLKNHQSSIISLEKFNYSINDEDASELIIRKLKALAESNSKIIFMLSGGIDSRYLLALSLKSRIEFETMTIGPNEHPDNKFAKILSDKYQISHKNIPILNDSEKLIKLLPEFVVKSRFFASASELNRKYIYEEYDFDGAIIIDGSFGEILRRGMYNKLQYQSLSDFKSKNKTRLAGCLSFYKADIFTNEISELLQRNAENQIAASIQDFDFQNNPEIPYWLDMLSVREKLLNFNALEQNRIDSLAMNYCPFSQIDVINAAFSMEMKQRKDARYIKKFIKNNYPELAEIPLVKGNVTVPFGGKTLTNKIIGKIKIKFGMKYKDESTVDFLKTVKDYGISHIELLKNYDFVDKNKLDNYISKYKNDDYSIALSLDWILTLAIFLNTNTSYK